MGFLGLFFNTNKAELAPTPKGSFTIDRSGRIMTSTLPRSFPQSRVIEIGKTIVSVFQRARAAEMPLHELFIQYGVLKIQAREMRGGAIVFLTPQSLTQESSTKLEN